MHTFQEDIQHLPLPQQFTYPFHYTPHPLCVMAATEVQSYLQGRTDWHAELQQGKMFGVLVVRSAEGTIGFLAAFSGNLAGSNHHDYFVPPVYDLLDPNGYFKLEEAKISEMNRLLNHTQSEMTSANGTSPCPLHKGEEYIQSLKEERKNRSIALQQWIFHQFILLNAKGEQQDIHQIFETYAHRLPPAGTGDCSAPKLLQHAYRNGLQPLAMAEFWWGNSPKGEIRRHGHYYPSCRHKCEPLMAFMLQGLDVEPNPLLRSVTDANLLQTVYEDEFLLVVNKPAGMLSVPGKTGQASVLTMLQERYPNATGPLLVHRLDMATSGLLLAAKDKDTHALLQQQFENRTVKKRYMALLEGTPQVEPKGFIRLPLRPDFDNRPLQMVDFEYGKPAVTRYEIINPPYEGGQGDVQPPRNNTSQPKTLIALYPETSRTHQLRVHCAHPDGLNCPIVGDPLYGQPAERLYLHAETLQFVHPHTQERVKISAKAPF